MAMGMILESSGKKYASDDEEVQFLLGNYVNTGLDGGYIPGELTDNSVAIIERHYPNANLRVVEGERTEEEEKGDPSPTPSDSLSLSEFEMVDDLPISLPAGWNDITPWRMASFQNPKFPWRRTSLQDPREDPYLQIRKAMYYTKKGNVAENELLSSKRILLFVIHGTFAHSGRKYFDVEEETYKAIMKYAATLGDSVELVSISWSGGNTDADRNKALNYMEFIFRQLYGNRDIFTQVNLLAHSHGGNIMNKMTSNSYFKSRIHNIFSIFTPVREVVAVNLDAITGKLYHFYSTADLVQYVGSFVTADFGMPQWKDMSFGFKGGRKATEITKAQSVSEQKALNYRVQFNAESPPHTHILPIVGYLGDIIGKTKQLYRYQSDFDLNIDTKNGQIELAIRRTYSNDVINQASGNIEAVLEAERNSSEQVENAYRAKYGGDIHEKHRIYATLVATYKMLTGG